MSVVRWFGVAFALGSLVACADVAEDALDDGVAQTSASELRTSLGDPGLGEDVPMPRAPSAPFVPGRPGWWHDLDWRLPAPSPVPPEVEGAAADPEARCGLTFIEIYDPGRARTIAVPIVRCD